MQALATFTHEVADGRRPARALADVLGAALGEAESFRHQLNDDTFTGDAASQAWREGATDAADSLCGGLHRMLRAVEGDAVDRASLLSGLEQTTEAERRVRDVYRGAHSYNAAVRQALEDANRVQCVRCGHRNMPGGSLCEQCRFQLPQMGIERVETDIVGGETIRHSVFLERLDALIDHAGSADGVAALVDFLGNLERLYVVGGRQLDMMLSRVPRDHAAVGYTLELRSRMESVRQMVEAVRTAVGNGQTDNLDDFRHWLAEQFNTLVDLKERVSAACA